MQTIAESCRNHPMPLKPANSRRCGLRSCTLVLALLSAAPSVASELDTANQDWAAGDFNSAVLRQKAVLQDNPNDAAARLLLGQIDLGNENGGGRRAAPATVSGSMIDALTSRHGPTGSAAPGLVVARGCFPDWFG